MAFPVLLSLAFVQPFSPSTTRLCSRKDLNDPTVRRQAVLPSGHPIATMLASPFAQLEEGERTLLAELPGLCSMARPNTLPLGTGLVALGAFGARRTAGAADGVGGRLCLSALLSAITTAGSMLINDYHDHKRGVDTEWTKPGRPLVTGEVQCR
jgi:hypothetical protein